MLLGFLSKLELARLPLELKFGLSRPSESLQLPALPPPAPLFLPTTTLESKKAASLADMLIDSTIDPPIRSRLYVIWILSWNAQPVSSQESSLSRLLKLPLVRRQVGPDHSTEDENHCEERVRRRGGREGR